jgi:hypothetical protein
MEEMINQFFKIIPKDYELLITLFLFTILIISYALFVYFFYKFISKKNIINLDLTQYNKNKNAWILRSLAFLLYILEYIIILPIIVSVGFILLSIFLLVLSKSASVITILTISAALVASVRIASYFYKDLATDLAKMLPLSLLGIFLIDPNFFSFKILFQRFNEITGLLNEILIYIIFIVLLEFFMRILELALLGIISFEKESERTTED